ncbi:hypothetical protein ACI799_12570 [Blastococcus sp. SYSU DS0753]
MVTAVTKARRAARELLLGSGGPARRYLAPGIDLVSFFRLLDEQQVSYVVLRWFESLPHVDEGEDVDILVADEDLAYVSTLLVDRRPLRGSQKFDVYTVSGLPGTDYEGIPYYPPRFARRVLAGAVRSPGGVKVPGPEVYFDSLAYHAVYHKGWTSGLPDGVRSERPRQTTDHDYEAVLAGLAAELGIAVLPTLDALDLYLHGKGLRPPLDTLERLVPTNPWLLDRFFGDHAEVDEVWRGLAVFVLRERAAGSVAQACRELDRQGFEVLDVVQLDAAQREAAAHRLRGGNWEQGPWPVSGGAPSVYLVAYDVAPRLVRPAGGGREVNVRIPAAKERLRDRLLRDVPREARYNPVHSSDNGGQALDYLEALGDPGFEAEVRGLSQRLVDGCAFPYPVLRMLSGEARRAQVAIVDHPVHGASVCKVFRPGAVRFFERELRARTELCDIPGMPELLEAGERWFVTPLYTDDRSHVLRQLPTSGDVQLRLPAARALARLARDLHERGLFLLDLSTQNLLSDPRAGLRVVDLEFLQEYAGPVPPLLDSYTFRGAPDAGGAYDTPIREWLLGPVGNAAFHPAVTGLPVAALLAAPTPAIRLRAATVQLVWYVRLHGAALPRRAAKRLLASPAGRYLRAARRVVRRLARGR